MAYEITYHDSPDVVFAELEQCERLYVQRKLAKIATNEYRQPREWDFTQIRGHLAEGRFRIGDSLRAFADIDDANQLIAVHEVSRRENLY